jgi:hypothetical protein
MNPPDLSLRSALTGRAALMPLASQIALAIYLQFIEWVPVPPWNDISRGNGQEWLDLAIAVISVLLALGTWRRWRPILGAAVLWLCLWLWLQVTSWWVPYFTGGSAQWRSVYARVFSRTYKFLPAIRDNPIPDAAHTVLTLLIIVALASTTMALIRVFATGLDRSNT